MVGAAEMTPRADLFAPPAIPPEARERAQELLQCGRLHRYSEAGATAESEAAALEREMAALAGTPYAVALNSCGSALFLALKGLGVAPGDPVLISGFTLAPVPGAILHADARPVLVEITEDLVIDLDDLARKARESGAKVLMMSHMRGHVCDLPRLMALCAELGVRVIEDGAHALGATWDGRAAGSYGDVGTFSFQSGKHVNAGEGGILVTSDADIAARAILHSGSYMLHAQHGARPPDAVLERWAGACANFSLRMPELTAAIARPQLPLLAARAADWNATHDALLAHLAAMDGVQLPHRPPEEGYVQSSLQFRLPGDAPGVIADFVARCRAGGLFVKWFGAEAAEGYTSAPRHWPGGTGGPAPGTHRILASLCDLRLPLGMSGAEIDWLAGTLEDSLAAVRKAQVRP